MSTVDRLFPTIREYGAEGSPVVTIERVDDSTDLPEIACFDFIEYDTKTVPYSQLTSDEKSGVAADERTIVLHFPSGYVCVDVEQLVGFAKNPNSKFYECRGYRSDHKRDDKVGKSFIRLGLGPGGSYFSVFTKNLVEFLKSGDRIVSVVSIPNSTVERTMSEDAAKQVNPNSYVSSNHCQDGSSLSLSYLAKTVIEGVPTLATWVGVDVPLVTRHHGDESFVGQLLPRGFNISEGVISFINTFNRPILSFRLEGISEVVFGDNFNQPIENVDWGNVKSVTFGYHFNQPVENVDWGNVEIVT